MEAEDWKGGGVEAGHLHMDELGDDLAVLCEARRFNDAVAAVLFIGGAQAAIAADSKGQQELFLQGFLEAVNARFEAMTAAMAALAAAPPVQH